MVRKIQITTLIDRPDKEWLGKQPERSDIGEIYHEDVDVYLPSGELAIVFRVGALKSTLPVDKGGWLTPEAHAYWRWVSKALSTDQRGMAAGKDIVSNPEIRLTLGQWAFFIQATRAKNPLTDEAEARALVLSDTKPSRSTFYVKRTEEDGLVDLEEIERWDSICRKKNVDPAVKKEATENRNKAKLAWFDKWFNETWVPAEDRGAAAKACKKRFITAQPRSNRCYSNVMGAIDRSGRIPYGRLTASTVKRYDEFVAQKALFHEVNDIFRETMPEAFADLNGRFSKVKDERYNLFGTAFTTLTVNNNFDVSTHYDGSNAVNGKAALFVMEKGDWSGGEFVFPQLGIGFDIRQGDIFIGDNQSLQHSMLPFEPRDMEAHGAENVMFVAYAKEDLLWMDDLECETCRKDFMEYAIKNHRDKAEGKNLEKWSGSWAGQWCSPEWIAFKESRGMQRCSNTNYCGS